MTFKGLLLLGLLLLFPCYSFRFAPGSTGCTARVRVRHGGNAASMTKVSASRRSVSANASRAVRE